VRQNNGIAEWIRRAVQQALNRTAFEGNDVSHWICPFSLTVVYVARARLLARD
jgi:hypothetical protein